jgi:tetratricopeptide (TPR) repeat protein
MPALHGQPLSERLFYLETLMPEYDYGWAPLAGLVDAQWKYIESPEAELYDLRVDPLETTNCFAKDDDIAANLTNWLDDLRTRTVAEPVQEVRMGAAALQRLRSLGYAAGSAGQTMEKTKPARKGDRRRDVKQSLSLTREYTFLTMRYTGGAWNANDYAKAQALVTASPESLQFQLLLARMAADAGYDATAETAFRRALELGPQRMEIWDFRALFATRRGRYADARADLVRALELGGGAAQQPLTAARLAAVELANGRPAAATNLLIEVLPLVGSEKCGTLKRLGDAILLLGDFPGALVCYEEALKERANWIPALESKAWALAAADATDGARAALACAWILCESSDHREPRDLETLAVAYAGAGKFDDAIKTGNRAVAFLAATGTNTVPAAFAAEGDAGELLADRWKRRRDRSVFRGLIRERLAVFLATWEQGIRPTRADIQKRLCARDFFEDEPIRKDRPEIMNPFGPMIP